MGTLDERILPIWLTAALVVAAAIGLGVGVIDAVLVGVGVWVGPAAFVVAMFLGALYVVVRYRTVHVEYDGTVLLVERGVVVRSRALVPGPAVRRVDVRQGPLARLAGVATLVVYVEGAAAATVALPGLPTDRARTLQERLREGAFETNPTKTASCP